MCWGEKVMGKRGLIGIQGKVLLRVEGVEGDSFLPERRCRVVSFSIERTTS